MRNETLAFSRATCSIAAALEIMGDKWTLLVLREAFQGLQRFDDLREALGCSRSVLTARLSALADAELLVRVPYQEEGARLRFEYALSTKGSEIFTILVALMQWGDRWAPPNGEPSVILKHAGCRAEVRAELRCAKGHGPLRAEETYSRPGAGAIRIP